MAYVYPPNRNSYSRPSLRLQRGLLFGIILIAALGAFELFNYATTEYALSTLIGGAQVLGLNWASVLALAFCAIDFAGLARLFTPEQGADEPKEVWYLFGAWFLGAAMNAIMTWWAVTNVLLSLYPLGNEVVSRQTLVSVVPVFVALLVWFTRILIIGTIGIAGDRLFTLGAGARRFGRSLLRQARAKPPVPASRPSGQPVRSQQAASNWPAYGPSRSASSPPRPAAAPGRSPGALEEDDGELTYEPVDDEKATSVPNWPRPGTNYTPGRPQPAPKPSYGYSTRAYGREIQPYVGRPTSTPRSYQAAAPEAGDVNTRFYR